MLTGQSAAMTARIDQVRQATRPPPLPQRLRSDQSVRQSSWREALLGDDFQIIPEFTLSAAQAAEWANALVPSTAASCSTYLKNTLRQIDFPVDEWLYSAARVRPMMHSWEAVLMCDAAFGVTPPQLIPIQLPFVCQRSLAGVAVSRRLHDRQRPPALHVRLFRGVRSKCATVRITARRVDGGHSQSLSAKPRLPSTTTVLTTSRRNRCCW